MNYFNQNMKDTELNNFSTISHKCEKIHLKLTIIYINKLFSNISNTEIP